MENSGESCENSGDLCVIERLDPRALKYITGAN